MSEVFAQQNLSTTNKKAINAYQDGLQALQERKIDEAFQQFEEAIERDNLFAEAYYQLGRLYEQNRQFGNAILNHTIQLLNIKTAEMYLVSQHVDLFGDAELMLLAEPLPGEVRLQYWRDLLEGSAHGETAANPVAAELLRAVQAWRLLRAWTAQLRVGPSARERQACWRPRKTMVRSGSRCCRH